MSRTLSAHLQKISLEGLISALPFYLVSSEFSISELTLHLGCEAFCLSHHEDSRGMEISSGSLVVTRCHRPYGCLSHGLPEAAMLITEERATWHQSDRWCSWAYVQDYCLDSALVPQTFSPQLQLDLEAQWRWWCVRDDYMCSPPPLVLSPGWILATGYGWRQISTRLKAFQTQPQGR